MSADDDLTPAPAPSPAPSADAAPPRRRRRARGLLWALMAVPLLMAFGVLVITWALKTETGSGWILARVPGLTLDQARGSLLGDFDVERAEFVLPGSEDRIVLEKLHWRGVRLAWSTSSLLWGEVRADQLAVDRVRLQFSSSSSEPTTAPTGLLSPVALTIADLRVGELYAPGLAQPLRGLRGSAAFGADGGEKHRVKVDALAWQQLTLSGQAEIATQADLKLASQWRLSQPGGELPWTAPFRLDGPLSALSLQGALEAAKQTLQLHAQLRPFAPFPLAQLQGDAKDLDLAALLPGTEGIPRTGLTGRIQLDPSTDKSQPGSLIVKADLSNSAAGRLDQDRLPLRELELDVLLDPSNWTRLRLPRLDAQLAGGARLRAVGQSSQKDGSALTLRLDGLDSRQIDRRWPTVLARGELRLSTDANLAKADADAALKVDGELAGRLGDAQLQAPLELALSAELRSQSITLRKLDAKSGPATMKATGALELNRALSAADGWKATAQATIQGLDPRRLTAGSTPEGALPQQLNGRLAAKLQSVRGSLWPQGTAQLDLQPSQWQGLPLQGQVQYARKAGAVPDLQADLRLADASLQARSRIDPALRRGGEQVDLSVELRAPRLASLQPLLRAQAPGAAMVGALTAQATLQLVQPGGKNAVYASEGRWQLQGFGLAGLGGLPPVSAAVAKAAGEAPLATATTAATATSPNAPASKSNGNGTGALNRLPLSIESANGDWTVSSQRDAKLVWTTTLKTLRAPVQSVRLDQATVELQGSWAQHRLTVETQGQVPLPPVLTQPTATRVVARSGAASGVANKLQLDPQGARARIALQGSLDTEPLAAWRRGGLWQTKDLQLLLQANQQERALLKAGPLSASVRLEPGLDPAQASVAAGRMEVLGAGVRWDKLVWQAPQAWDVQIALEPLDAAPVLAKLQPDFGWGGDLRIDGHLNSRRDARGLSIDLMIGRTAGDLTVTDEVSTQRLGLTDLRIGLLADQGVWHLIQGIAGQNMGAVGGAVTARTGDPLALPTAKSKLEGAIEAKVENMGNWGPWLPAGWRVGGSMAATLSLAGTVGAPEVRGTAGAQKLSLRNPLMGVDMSQGEMALTMSGTQAKLDKFSAKAGQGTVNAEGSLHFGAQPSAALSLTADNFALLQRVDRRVVASGTAQIKASAQLLDLQGRFVVNEGLFDFSRGDAPQLDSDVQVVRMNTPPKRAEIDGKPLRIKLALDVELGRRLQLKGYGIDTRIRGALKLAQDGQPKPTLEGEVRSEGGTFNAYGQKLIVERGIFNFIGPLDNPRLDVLAIRPGMENEDVRVGVTVTGTASSPRIKLYSDPDMSETNKLSWLVLGRSPDNLGRSDTALMQRAAMALISGDGESASDKLIHNIGLDELSFSGEGDDARGTVVRLGKQVSRNVFVAYERGLNATTGNWQLIYKLAQKFTVRAQAGEDQQGLDLIWQWKWE